MSLAAPATAAPAGEAKRCAECGNLLGGRYCSACGQEADIQLPTFREFLHEAVGEHIAIESKLFRTLWVLLRSPGLLTAEYVAGRRQRYLRPLRLYLTLSLVFFLALSFTSKTFLHVQNHQQDTSAAGTAKPAPATSSAATAPAAAAKQDKTKAADSNMDVQFDDSDSTGSAFLDDKFKRFSKLSDEEKSKALSQSLEQTAPYAIFVLMPLFAAGLKLLYLGSGRTYGEHFVFALHAQAFSYLVMLIGRIKALPVLEPAEDAIFVVMGAAMVLYLYLAMRRFYRSAYWSTLLRMGVLLFAYSIALAIALALSALIVVVQ